MHSLCSCIYCLGKKKSFQVWYLPKTMSIFICVCIRTKHNCEQLATHLLRDKEQWIFNALLKQNRLFIVNEKESFYITIVKSYDAPTRLLIITNFCNQVVIHIFPLEAMKLFYQALWFINKTFVLENSYSY